MLPCVCSVIDHRWRENVIRTKKWHILTCICFADDRQLTNTSRSFNCHVCLRSARKRLFYLFNFLNLIDFFYSFRSGSRPVNEESSEMRAVFLNITKAFDRHRGLIAKLRSIGVKGNLLNWFITYLSCRKKSDNWRSALRLHSSWCPPGIGSRSITVPYLYQWSTN